MEQAPYRQNARSPSAWRPRTRRPLRTSVRRWLETPRYVALGLLGAAAITLGRLNLDIRSKHEMVAPRVESLENILAWAAVASVPLLAVLVHRRWRRLPAPRGTKRRHIMRTVLSQIVAATLAVLALRGVRPSSKPILGITTRGDRTAYVYRGWGCGYEVWANDGAYAVRPIAALGPFACDAPVPRVDLREGSIALVGENGKDLGLWNVPVQ